MPLRRAAALALTLTALAGTAVADEPKKVKAPKGEYSGKKVFILVSDKEIALLSVRFPCARHDTKGATSLNDVPLKKTKRGYKFSIDAHGSASYEDGHPDENVAVAVSGQFTRDAKKVRGRFSVHSPYCGSTGKIKWRATR
jgi:hypothetical protein